MVDLKRLSCLGEEQQMSGHKIIVGGQSWSGSIPCPNATMSKVGHKLPQQLGPLVSGLKDRGDSLSQGRWRRWVPVRLRVLGLSPSVVSVLHSIFQTSYH
jgi:hypothetical protein